MPTGGYGLSIHRYPILCCGAHVPVVTIYVVVKAASFSTHAPDACEACGLCIYVDCNPRQLTPGPYQMEQEDFTMGLSGGIISGDQLEQHCLSSSCTQGRRKLSPILLMQTSTGIKIVMAFGSLGPTSPTKL